MNYEDILFVILSLIAFFIGYIQIRLNTQLRDLIKNDSTLMNLEAVRRIFGFSTIIFWFNRNKYSSEAQRVIGKMMIYHTIGIPVIIGLFALIYFSYLK